MKDFANTGSCRFGNIETVNIEDGVTSIGNYAFCNCDVMKSINIPNSVTIFGDYSFYYCYSITSIKTPDHLNIIGDDAFFSCQALKTINIPNTVGSIGRSAFGYCYSLETISIPASVTEIGDSVFDSCRSLTSINVAPNNVFYSSQDGVFFDKTKKTLIQYPVANERESYNIPNSVVRIKDDAIRDCKYLKTINVPASVKEVGDFVFFSCESLISINVDSNNQYYSSQDGVFFDKNKKTLIQYPTGNTRQNYIIPNSVTLISSYAMAYSQSLLSVNIPNSVEKIDYCAFSICRSLTSINIPSSVKEIGISGFSGCTSLKCVSYEGKKDIIHGNDVFGDTPINDMNPIHVPKDYEGDYFADKKVSKDNQKCEAILTDKSPISFH